MREAAPAGGTSAAWLPVLIDVRCQCAAIVNEFFRSKRLADAKVSALIDLLSPSDDS